MLLNVVCFLSLGVCGWIVSLCSGYVGCCAFCSISSSTLSSIPSPISSSIPLAACTMVFRAFNASSMVSLASCSLPGNTVNEIITLQKYIIQFTIPIQNA